MCGKGQGVDCRWKHDSQDVLFSFTKCCFVSIPHFVIAEHEKLVQKYEINVVVMAS